LYRYSTGKFPKQALEANVAALSEGKASLPYGKFAEGVASPVVGRCTLNQVDP
jgi:hypothetical protein